MKFKNSSTKCASFTWTLQQPTIQPTTLSHDIGKLSVLACIFTVEFERAAIHKVFSVWHAWLFNLNLWTVAEGVGFMCCFIASTKSLYDVLPNFDMLQDWLQLTYVTACLLLVNLISFARKKCYRCSIYWVQSSLDGINLSNFPIWNLAIHIAIIVSYSVH